MTLQNEISQMIDKLEDIKDSYENELEQKDNQLNNVKHMALKQLREMQQTMRQDTVSSHKEIMKLQEELKIKLQNRDKAQSLTSRRKEKEHALGQRKSARSPSRL